MFVPFRQTGNLWANALVDHFAMTCGSLPQDPKFMPKEKSCWSAWNGLNLPGAPAVVTYWINKLQPGACTEGKDVFVTLNPPKDCSIEIACNRRQFNTVQIRLDFRCQFWCCHRIPLQKIRYWQSMCGLAAVMNTAELYFNLLQ